jgi:hypothetical protein
MNVPHPARAMGCFAAAAAARPHRHPLKRVRILDLAAHVQRVAVFVLDDQAPTGVTPQSASQVGRQGWRSLRAPDESSRRFWAVAIGVILEGYAMGRSPEALCAEMLRVLGEQAKSNDDAARLRLVDARDASSNSNEEG